MDITVKEMKRADLLIINGRVDSSTAPDLGEMLTSRINQGTYNLVVDLEQVNYMSSAGLREMVSVLKKVKSSGGDLRISNPSERVIEVLDLAGLTSLFEIYDDQVSAVGSF